MNKPLSPDTVKQYQREGILDPLPAITTSEASRLFQLFEEYEPHVAGRVSGKAPKNVKPHLLLPWLNDLLRDPRILDAVEELIGPDILCWTANFFSKSPGDNTFVSWHQDSTYWGLSTPDVVTAWVAFTHSTVESGCMRVIPGSHLVNQLPHRDTFAEHNLLSRGQEVAVEVDESKAHDVVLAPGEMSLHHVRIVHGSGINRSTHRRIGFAIRYVATRVRQTAGIRDSATLVRGSDRYNHFDHEPRPRFDFDPDTVAYHTAMADRVEKILYRGAKR
jgi:non-haem Fe2+, alpha-ketoglutarate-dependent halogenase